VRELSVLALLFAVACSGKSAGDISSSTGGSDNAGESGSNTGGSAGTSGGSDGGASPTSGGNGAAPSGGSSGSAGNGASGGNAGTSGGSAGDSGNGGNAGEGATAGDGGSGGSGGSGRCEDVTTLEECDARSDCHSVFFDPNDCACAALGCCARFSSCAGGDLAECDGMVTCRRAAPYCAGQYVISYEGTCYEGCVRSSECLP
jgi:hypothetical protein